MKILFTFYKITIFLLSICLYNNNCIAATENDNLLKLNLKGKVKAVTEIPYSVVSKNGKILKGEKYNAEIQLKLNLEKKLVFDLNGQKIEENYYNFDGSLSSKDIYIYNNNGHLIRKNTYFNYEGNTYEFRYHYKLKFDDSGNKIEAEEISNYISNKTSKETYRFDSRGNLIDKYLIDKFDNTTRWTYKYDSKSNIIEEKTIWSILNLGQGEKITYKYNENGDKIEEIWYNRNGSIDWTLTYQYVYDKKGNWINRIKFYNGVPDSILERTIEYFN